MFDEIMSMYNRKDALEEGVLVDVTESAKSNGFKIPVAITSAVDAAITNIPEEHSYQTYEARLNDVLYMGHLGCRKNGRNSSFIYPLILYREEEKGHIKGDIKLKMVISGGDDLEPVITIMLPHED